MIRIPSGILVLLTSVAWLNAADPPPPKPKSSSSLTVLEKSPASYIGVRVTVKSNAALQLNDGEEYTELVVENDEKTPVTRLKFRLAPSLASQLSDNPQVKGSPVRLVGVVLGPEEGKGPYVIHLDEVSLLDPKGNVTKTYLLKKDTDPVKPSPVEIKPTPAEVKPTIEVKKPEPKKVEPKPVEVKKSEPKVQEPKAETKVAPPVTRKDETPETQVSAERVRTPVTKASPEKASSSLEIYATIGVVIALLAGTGIYWLLPRKHKKVILDPKKARAMAAQVAEPPVEKELPKAEKPKAEKPKLDASGIAKKPSEPAIPAAASNSPSENITKTVSDRLSRRIR